MAQRLPGTESCGQTGLVKVRLCFGNGECFATASPSASEDAKVFAPPPPLPNLERWC